MPRIPGLSDLIGQLQAQTEALAQLPRTMTDLNGAVRELIDAVGVASETIASTSRTAERLEQLVEELEEPVRALRPGLERVGRVLDDPVVDTVPDTLRRIHDDLMPMISSLRQAQSRVGSVTGLLRRRGRLDGLDAEIPLDDEAAAEAGSDATGAGAGAGAGAGSDAAADAATDGAASAADQPPAPDAS